MSRPQAIKARRESIAKLTRSPLAGSPIPSPSPRTGYLDLFQANSAFLKADGDSVNSQNGSATSDFSESTDLAAAGARQYEQKLLDLVLRHVNDANSLSTEGADITRDIYRFGERPRAKRTRSLSLVDVENVGSRRGSTASSLNVPGGFRREFILSRSNKRAPNLLTRNFVEFLSIYGHFAGEDLEDDDAVACHYEPLKPLGDAAPLVGHYNPNGTATDTKAYFLLVKAFVGTGVLFLPKAFSSGGLVFSTVTLFLFGILSFWCYLVLVYAKMAVGVSSFGEIGRVCYGTWLQQLILISIIISQVGFVATYIVFTAENLRAFLCNVSSFKSTDIDIFWFILLEACILTPLSLIRDITKLSLLALLANGFIMIGLVTIVAFTFQELVGNLFEPGSGIHYLFNRSEFSLFIGVAIFAFEGIGLIIPIQESMIYPRNFPKVLLKVMLTISSIFVFVGSLGYLTFGDKIDTVILLNLPQDSPLIIMIQLLYALAILLSTPIQIFPAVRLIELRLFRPTDSGKLSLMVKWQKNLVRLLFVLLTAVLALYGGQNLDKFVSFVGCFACIPLVYMYPPMLHLKSCCDYKNATTGKRSKYWLAVLDYILVAIGGVALVYTTYDILAH